MSELEILQATVTHLRRELRVKEMENQRLRAELRQLRPPVEQVRWERRSHYQNQNQQNGVEK